MGGERGSIRLDQTTSLAQLAGLIAAQRRRRRGRARG